jgi:hypothetical protein
MLYHQVPNLSITIRDFCIAVYKVKDAGERAAVEAELVRGAEGVHWAALRARACLLMGPPFDDDARKPNGRVLKWIASLLAAPPNVRLHPGLGAP